MNDEESTQKPVWRRRDALAGVYVHVPFCARQCPYCDFAVDVRRDIPHREYAEALITEFQARRSNLEGRSVQTIYFGGGTPSLWSVDEFERVLSHLRSALAPNELKEVCLEANPTDVSRENLGRWVEAGVTRLSIGVQSFQARVLEALNRNHDRRQAIEAVELALTEGPPVVSFDLIYGNPDQTLAEWRADLDMIERFEGLCHLSAYHLTIEPGTAFARRVRRGRLDLPGDDIGFEMLDELIDRCESLGLERYEVSNFARAGARSRHNTLYWTGGEYLGIGVGAHSLRIDDEGAVVRRANPRETSAYLDEPARPAECEELSAIQHLVERLFLGIRTREGLDFDELAYQFEDSISREDLQRAQNLFETFEREGFVERVGVNFVPTHRGLDVADSLAARCMDAFEP